MTTATEVEIYKNLLAQAIVALEDSGGVGQRELAATISDALQGQVVTPSMMLGAHWLVDHYRECIAVEREFLHFLQAQEEPLLGEEAKIKMTIESYAIAVHEGEAIIAQGGR